MVNTREISTRRKVGVDAKITSKKHLLPLFLATTNFHAGARFKLSMASAAFRWLRADMLSTLRQRCRGRTTTTAIIH